MSKRRIGKQLTRLQRVAFTTATARQMLDFQFHLEESQWWPTAKIVRFQEKHLASLLAHTHRHIPYYRRLFEQVGFVPGEDIRWKQWRHLPVLRRSQLQEDPAALRAPDLPPGHEETSRLRSSGSTGRAVEVMNTNTNSLWQTVLNLRSQLWADRDFSRKMGVIRKLSPGEAPPPDGDTLDRWGPAALFPFPTGPCVRLSAAAEIGVQREWIERRRPTYLTTFPSILLELARDAPAERVAQYPIESVSTLGEAVDDDLRDLVQRKWNCRVFDVYSAEEVGCISIECPEGGGYHVQAEALIVEVLRRDGTPSAPGEIGEVVVTPLYNYAMPLLRYSLGDYAELGDSCRCGRGLPLLRRIVGRQRNMLVLGDGRVFWPSFGTREFVKIAPILQQQFHQSAPDRLEVRLVVTQPLNQQQEDALKHKIHQSLPAPFQIDFRYMLEIPRNTGGKFELFTSAVADARHGRNATSSA